MPARARTAILVGIRLFVAMIVAHPLTLVDCADLTKLWTTDTETEEPRLSAKNGIVCTIILIFIEIVSI
jgi:hypothetical protein